MLCRKIVSFCRHPPFKPFAIDPSACNSSLAIGRSPRFSTSESSPHDRPHQRAAEDEDINDEGKEDMDRLTGGRVSTPSLKKEITTKDIFLAKRRETEERLSQRGGLTVEKTLHGTGGAVHPSEQLQGTAHTEHP